MARTKEQMRETQKKAVEVRRIRKQIIEATQAGDLHLAQKLAALLPEKKQQPKRFFVSIPQTVIDGLARLALTSEETVYQVAARILTNATNPQLGAIDMGAGQYDPSDAVRFASGTRAAGVVLRKGNGETARY